MVRALAARSKKADPENRLSFGADARNLSPRIFIYLYAKILFEGGYLKLQSVDYYGAPVPAGDKFQFREKLEE